MSVTSHCSGPDDGTEVTPQEIEAADAELARTTEEPSAEQLAAQARAEKDWPSVYYHSAPPIQHVPGCGNDWRLKVYTGRSELSGKCNCAPKVQPLEWRVTDMQKLARGDARRKLIAAEGHGVALPGYRLPVRSVAFNAAPTASRFKAAARARTQKKAAKKRQKALRKKITVK